MIFSSPLFLFRVLPVLLFIYLFLRDSHRRPFLLCASLFLYAWAEPAWSWNLLFTILISLTAGIGISSSLSDRFRKRWLIIGISGNLLLLIGFKYTTFILEAISPLLRLLQLSPIPLPTIPLPLGISFSTFLGISFLVDLHRQPEPEPSRSGRFSIPALYISFFPTILAGPITPYRELSPQLRLPTPDPLAFSTGITRFITGFAKKVIIADPLGELCRELFGLPPGQWSFSIVWVGMIAFTLQIYFDFSGYSDMAVGLGRIFGFRFMENFNHPYIADSIRDFWTRWHKSLTRWLRDYLFLPFSYSISRRFKRDRYGGIRIESWAYGAGILLTWVICGFWHGAAWTFIFWGMFHGLMILGERFLWGKPLKRIWKPLQHLYALTVVIIGWVFFHATSIKEAFSQLGIMLGLTRNSDTLSLSLFLNREHLEIFIIALMGTMPLQRHGERLGKLLAPASWPLWSPLLKKVFLAIVFIISIVYMANATFQPFIYFRF